MGFTITDCTRCGGDFMYHNSDTHLQKDSGIICQDCKVVEDKLDFIQTFFNFHDYETYILECDYTIDSGHIHELASLGLMCCSGGDFRKLTKEEFNSRFMSVVNSKINGIY